MKLHYISCHAVLEYDECRLLSDMKVEVCANGAYRDPKGAYTLPRPGIPNMAFNQKFFDLTAVHPKTNLPPELIQPFDVIMVMHSPEVLFENWEKIKHKRVIWRSIGQSTPSIEAKIKPLKDEGLQIIRYSIKEKKLANFAGCDALIPFYKDPDEFCGWTGEFEKVVNLSQSLLGRRYFTHYDELMAVAGDLDFKVYGSGNDDLGTYNGGDIPYELMKQKLREARVFLYGGTWPAPYTLSLIEAMMTGIPVVAIGRKLAESDRFEKIDFYEIPDIIDNGIDGFFSDDLAECKGYVHKLLKDYDLARKIGERGRQKAIKLFGKAKVEKLWHDFLIV